ADRRLRKREKDQGPTSKRLLVGFRTSSPFPSKAGYHGSSLRNSRESSKNWPLSLSIVKAEFSYRSQPRRTRLCIVYSSKVSPICSKFSVHYVISGERLQGKS